MRSLLDDARVQHHQTVLQAGDPRFGTIRRDPVLGWVHAQNGEIPLDRHLHALHVHELREFLQFDGVDPYGQVDFGARAHLATVQVDRHALDTGIHGDELAGLGQAKRTCVKWKKEKDGTHGDRLTVFWMQGNELRGCSLDARPFNWLVPACE